MTCFYDLMSDYMGEVAEHIGLEVGMRQSGSAITQLGDNESYSLWDLEKVTQSYEAFLSQL